MQAFAASLFIFYEEEQDESDCRISKCQQDILSKKWSVSGAESD